MKTAPTHPLNLRFKGPFSLDTITNPKSGHFLISPAIYIWGFKDSKEHFIPYYVGIVFGNDNLGTRFKNRRNEISKPNSTYLRLTKSYLFGEEGCRPFYTDASFPPSPKHQIEFPVGKATSHHWCIDMPGIAYLNSWTWAGKQPKQPEYTLRDHLSDAEGFQETLVLGKMEVLYAEIAPNDPVTGLPVEKSTVEMGEAFVKYSLKGKTVSRANHFSHSNGRIKRTIGGFEGIQQELNRLSALFSIESYPDHDIFKKVASIDFPGYH